MRYAAWPAAALLMVGAATGAWAQQKGAPPAQTPADQCDLKTSHFAVSRAVLYIQNASSAQDGAKKQQALDGAHRSLIEALEQGQDKNPAVWYFLGVGYAMKLDLDAASLTGVDSTIRGGNGTPADSAKADSLRRTFVGDVTAADTSLDKVEAMMPSCEKDIEQYRYAAWASATNQGIDAMRDNQYDKAKEAFALANRVYGKKPTAFFYMASLFATEDNADSSLHYFKAAAQIAEGDTSETEIHEKATQNVARIYQVLEKWDSAQAYFKAYVQVRPDDLDGQTNLANVYLAGGDTASAVKIYDELLAKPEGMDPLDVFRIGVSLFRADHADRAAVAFESALKRNPNYRNGLFNLTNAYFSLAQATQNPDSVKYWAGKMLPVTQQLVQIDPLNRGVLRLLAAAHQFVGNGDSTDAVLKKVNAMMFEVEVQGSRATSGGYEVQGTITAIRPQAAQAVQDTITRDSTRLETLKRTTVPAAQRAQARANQTRLQNGLTRLRTKLQQLNGPVNVPTITFEFLGADGNVVATESVAAQTIEPNGSKQFQLTPTAQGIVAWRYKAS